MRSVTFTRNAYKPGGGWFVCDRCGQRHRRSQMLTEWDGLKVDKACLDPRPPTMFPPDIDPYEGMAFPDARPPQDNGDRLQDESYLTSITGGIGVTNGQIPDNPVPGASSPQNVLSSPVPLGPNVLADDITIRTGVIPAPDVSQGN